LDGASRAIDLRELAACEHRAAGAKLERARLLADFYEGREGEAIDIRDTDLSL